MDGGLDCIPQLKFFPINWFRSGKEYDWHLYLLTSAIFGAQLPNSFGGHRLQICSCGASQAHGSTSTTFWCMAVFEARHNEPSPL